MSIAAEYAGAIALEHRALELLQRGEHTHALELLNLAQELHMSSGARSEGRDLYRLWHEHKDRPERAERLIEALRSRTERFEELRKEYLEQEERK